MVKTLNMALAFMLQMFAEGGDGGDGDGAGAAGVIGQDAAAQTGEETQQDAAVDEGADLDAEFEELIKGKYKAQYGKLVQDTVQKRMKNHKIIEEKYNKLAPAIDTLAKSYGIDSNDIDALVSAVDNDDHYIETEAFKNGRTIEDQRAFTKIERENARLSARLAEQEQAEQQKAIDAIKDRWNRDSEALKQQFPQFDFDKEMQNPQFAAMMRSGVPVDAAFKVLHQDEIYSSAMQYTAQQTAAKVANAVKANGSRPSENGLSGQAAAVTKTNVSNLSDAEIDEIIRRVGRGEKIKL